MAREITGVDNVHPNGRRTSTILYVFPISPRVVDGRNADVVPFRTAQIPERLRSELTAAQLASINAGDSGFVMANTERLAGETDTTFHARLRIDYDALVPFAIARERDRAVNTGDFDLRRFQLDR